MKNQESTIARENYLKIIVKHLTETGQERMAPGEISRLLGVSSGTVSVMIQRLEKAGYVVYESHKGCRLTPQGQAYGINILRRHRLIELFLVKCLDLDWTEVHDEAEALEHAFSEKLTDKIDAYLGYPARDPHGDPIPSKGQVRLVISDTPLSRLGEQQRGVICRVEGSNASLAYFQEEGLVPGTTVQVTRKKTETGLVGLLKGGKENTYALSALEGIFLELE